MRIVSGLLKGKKLEFLKSPTTRPLRDFVKENIFNIISHSSLISVKLEQASVLDLYSGIGSFGIECISRGVKLVTFIENNNKALTILKKNINNLKIEKQSEVFSEKTTSFFNRKKNIEKFDIIFLDPPFAENFFTNELEVIKSSIIYKKKHLIVIHREINSKDKLDKIINVILTRDYGRSRIIFGTF